MNARPAPQVFRDKESEHWFYAFDYNWSVYRSTQGYKTKEEAQKASIEHWDRVNKQN
jgi:uncharacterized protein YegP (UPF0339 family)